MDLSDALTCPVCLDVYETPLFLPCSHNLCRRCVEPLLIKIRGRDRYQFSCPECRHKMILASVDHLKLNRTLQGIIEQYQNKGLCIDMDKESNESSLCDEHGYENMRFAEYCKDCEEPVCYKCMAYTHKDHSICGLEETWNTKQTSFHADLKTLELENTGMEVFISKLRHISQEVKKKGDEIKQRISAECDKLVQIIEEKKILMVHEIDEEQEAKLLSLKEQITDCEMKLKQSKKHVDFAKSSQSADFATKLKAGQVMTDRIRKDKKEHLTLMPVTVADFSPIIFDTSTERAVLSDMYFIKVTNPGPSDEEICELLRSYEHKNSFFHSISGSLSSIFKSKHESGTEFEFHPQTAHRNLKLVNQARTVCFDRNGAEERCLATPSSERFTRHPVIFGNVSISYGKHYWEVSIARSPFCRIGVSYPSLPRDKGLGDNELSWCFEKYMETRNVVHGLRTRALDIPPGNFGLLGVYLDYNAGKLAFFNANTKKHLYTFHDKFIQTLCPTFEVNKGEVTLSTGLEIPEFVAKNMKLIASS